MIAISRTGIASMLGLLKESQVEQIHNGALYILNRTGLVIHDPNVLSLLDRSGCSVNREDRRAYFPPKVVEQALSSAPPVVKLFTRTGQPAMALGEGPLHARISSGATGMLDLESGLRREPTCRDAAQVVKLADALPHIHGVSTMAVQPADVPASVVDVHALKIALENTTKPLGYVCLNPPMVESVIEMAAAVVGGEGSLGERPIITALAESTSPLQLVSSQLTVLQAFAS
ncbi:MAG: trimethylamine methyltransferase family protein, partial [Anaerolineales bacterium]|nr:trimethylamine methyltransferase family protein [Anaerolineales bacterium]